MGKTQRVAILGAGIMGCSTALFLARRGMSVTLFDSAPQAFFAASRWNEGKIHLGHMYNADHTTGTAKLILPGSLQFKPLIEELIGYSIDAVTTSCDDIYLCHRDSVVDSESMWRYFQNVDQMIRDNSEAHQYLVDVSKCRSTRLTSSELNDVSSSKDIVAGFRIPERSVSTIWIADRFLEALRAENRIEPMFNTKVTAVKSDKNTSGDGPWYIETTAGKCGSFDMVINALWEGKLAIDATAGLTLPDEWSHRYRRALFINTSAPLNIPSTIIATGPFGDVKNYNGKEFYLSWYPKGLSAYGTELLPPELPALTKNAENDLSNEILNALERFIPGIADLKTHTCTSKLRGGWVYAAGQGKLSDRKSSLHKRSDFGVTRQGTYISIDTGKYCTAPWLAKRIADDIA